MTTDPSPVRSSDFRFQTPTLFWPRIELYGDRLELKGWRWFERYQRSIPLERVLQVNTSEGTLVVWLVDGRVLRLAVEDAAAWREAIDARL